MIFLENSKRVHTSEFLAHSQKNARRLELSISKNTPHGRWGQGACSVDPRFPAGLPFPVPEILEFLAFGDSGKFFQQFSRNFPGNFLQNSRKDPRNSHSLLEFSDTKIWGGTWHWYEKFSSLEELQSPQDSNSFQESFKWGEGRGLPKWAIFGCISLVIVSPVTRISKFCFFFVFPPT